MTRAPALRLADIRARWMRDARAIPPAAILAALAADPRPGAARLLVAARARRARRAALRARARALLRPERRLRAAGVRRIGGVDEAGVGPLAGPVVAAVVVLPQRPLLEDLDDSKVLGARVRQRVFDAILACAPEIGIGVVQPAEIDRLNVYRASLEAMRLAVLALGEPPEHLLVDARRIPGIGVPQTSIVHGDSLSASIAAASVIAKVTRDRIMLEWDRRWPAYGFARHKGYGTADHLEALQRHGPCPIHRLSFTGTAARSRPEPLQRGLEFS